MVPEACAASPWTYSRPPSAVAEKYRSVIALYPEKQVEVILGGDPTRRKLLTVEQLVAVVHESSAGLPAIPLFVHETLEDTARALWESAAGFLS